MAQLLCLPSFHCLSSLAMMELLKQILRVFEYDYCLIFVAIVVHSSITVTNVTV